MAVTGTIWRCLTGNGSIATCDSKIEFDVGTVPDALGHIRTTEFLMTEGFSENPKPNSDNPNELQEMGLAQVAATVTGYIESPTTQGATAILRNWMREPKTTKRLATPTSAFPYGRFGIKLTTFPDFDSSPTTTSGYFLTEVFVRQPFDQQYKLEFISKLRFNGDITKLGVVQT